MSSGDEGQRSALTLSTAEIIDVWKTGIETQKHFAELSVKMRQIGLTVAGAILTIAVFLVRQDEAPASFMVAAFVVPILSVLFLAAAAVLLAARIIDVFVYHKMLRGAVKFNEVLESQYPEVFANIGLTKTISVYSRCKEKPELGSKKGETELRDWEGTTNADAGGRISLFYWIPILALSVLSILFILMANYNAEVV